jgi:hypothetical protein
MNAWMKTAAMGMPGNIMDSYKLDGSKGSDMSGYEEAGSSGLMPRWKVTPLSPTQAGARRCSGGADLG